ncbi:endonuclease/exonuclease/phosphatase family protein [Halosquirtibacter laminarini]|uniref:Endonuclease/exonuclease/phosphatase family protein n=1 Tax=Halosquirtibacter laminarini TaxID=3374600 RepID=A0AC61NQU3_9BACT|nr:endonuclease/exonuclease/phosphatase family protein [Prolixibacteraceae bacterium]
MKKLFFLFQILTITFLSSCEKKELTVRFSTFNSALNRPEKGMLIKDLQSGSVQAQNVASIIQEVNPDVLCIQEFDYDAKGVGLRLFMKEYLEKGDKAVHYPYFMMFPSNTGVLSESDINKDNKLSLPQDGYGFGAFEGQYAFVILSKYPIDKDAVRTFQYFKWKQMPNPNWPVLEDGSQWFNDTEKEDLRISSKNHVDVPIKINNHVIHAIIAHPTPPVFDGEEDRNGKRNYDEIRLIKDYVEHKSYMVDDKGTKGGLKPNASFVIMGDMNADPVDGDSFDSAIVSLLQSETLNSEVAVGDKIPFSKGATEYNKTFKWSHKGPDNQDTNVFGLRIDYVLPSADLIVLETSVFWKEKSDALGVLTFGKNASDHRLVWSDVVLK